MTEQSDDLITMDEAAALLGVTPRQFYRIKKAEQLPTVDSVVGVATRQPAPKVRRGDVEQLKRKREGSTEES